MASRKLSSSNPSGTKQSALSISGPANDPALARPASAPAVPSRPNLLGGLRRHKSPKAGDFAPDFAHAVDVHFEGTAEYSAAPFGDDGILADKDAALHALATCFPGFDETRPAHAELAATVLGMEAATGQPFSNGIALAFVLANATGKDPDRAAAAIRNWANPAGADPTTQADIFEAHCALAQTPLGWKVLETMVPSPWVKPSDTEQQRLRTSTALTAAGHLTAHANPTERPTTLDEASDLARKALQPDTPGFERNALAARALLAVQSNDPTVEQREAALLFRSAGVTDTGTLSNVRKKVKGILGRGDKPPRWIARAFKGEPFPVNTERIMEALAQQTMNGISQHARARLPAVGATPATLSADTIADAACVAKLAVMGERIDRKGFRAPMKVGRLAARKIEKATAELLHVDTKTLDKHPAWKDIAADASKPLDIESLASLAQSRHLDDDAGVGKQLTALTRLNEGFASRIEGFGSLLDDMKPGSEIEFSSSGVRGVNVTGWAAFAADAARYLPWVPTVIPMPTIARLRGRESSVSLRGDEGPDGAYVDITVRSVDRRVKTNVAGIVGQWNVAPVVSAAYLAGEVGWHTEDAKGEVVTIRVSGEKGETFDDVKARAGKVMDSLGQGSWEGLAKDAWLDPHVSVLPGSTAEKAKASFGLLTEITGVNIPHHPTKGWFGLAPQLGVSRGNKSARVQAGGGSETSLEEDVARSRALFSPFQNLPSAPLGTHPSPAGAVGASAGLGSFFPALKKGHKTLVSRNIAINMDGSGRLYRQVTVDAETYEKWRTNQAGSAVLAPPLAPDLALPPGAPSTRGGRSVEIRQYVRPEEQRKLSNLFDLAKTITGAGGDPGMVGAAMREAAADESVWGEYRIFDQRTVNAERARGPAAYVGLLRATQGLKMRSSEPIGAPINPNRLNGTTPLVKVTAPEQQARLRSRNEPTRFAPAAPGFKFSPMQAQLRNVFSRYPKAWQVEPKPVSTHADTYGDLFKLVQLRGDIHPADSPIGRRMKQVLGSDGSAAFIGFEPKRDPARIMSDFNELKAEYWLKKTGQLGGEQVELDELDPASLQVWSEFDLGDFLEANFTKPNAPAQAFQFDPYPALPMGTHIERMREQSAAGAATGSRQSSSASMPAVKGLLAAGKFDRARSVLDGDAAEIERTGAAHRGDEAQAGARVPAMSFTLNAGEYATALGDDSHLVPYLPAMMIEYRNRQRGFDQLTAGQMFNGVAMTPDGAIVLKNNDYSSGPRPGNYAEDVKAAREARKAGIDPQFVYAHRRQSAASGIDMSMAHNDPANGRPELPFLASLQENAHLAEAETVLIRALKAAGHDDMAEQIRQVHGRRLKTLRDTFIERKPDGSVDVGAYRRLRQGELHPLVTAELSNALWANIATGTDTPEAAQTVVEKLERLLTPAGLGSTEADTSPERGDGRDRIGAMHNLKAVEGLERLGEHDKAKALAMAYTEGAWATYVLTGHTWAKNGFDATPNVAAGHEDEADMTMTNETLAYFASRYPECQAILDRPMKAASTLEQLREYEAKVHAYQTAQGVTRTGDDPLSIAIEEVEQMAQRQGAMTTRMRAALGGTGASQP